jgi:hypothetical protein
MSRSRGAAPPMARASRSGGILILLADVHNTGGRKDSGSTTMRHEATKASAEAAE